MVDKNRKDPFGGDSEETHRDKINKKNIFIKMNDAIGNKAKKIGRKFKNSYEDLKAHPKSFRKALASFFVIGLGQLLNKQKYKAIPLFLVLALFLAFEIFTSDYFWAISGELAQYPAEPNGKIYFFRDYGGFLTKGIWGLVTLGVLVVDDRYRGMFVKTNDNLLTWLSADRSIDLLGNGIITVVLLTFLVAFWIYSIRDAYVTSKNVEYKNAEVESSREYFSRVWQTFFAYIIMLPALVLMMFFTVIPFLFAFLIAFTNYTYRVKTSVHLIRWTGFDAFKFLFANPDWFNIFVQVFLWTILWAIMASVTVYVVGLIQAMVVESRYTYGRKFWRLSLILPWAIPAMISLMVFRNAFHKDGLINQLLFKLQLMEPVQAILRTIGLLGQSEAETGIEPIFWFESLQNGALARAVVILVNLWLGAPYFMMLIIGVLNTISQDLYEAAEIDGASAFQKFRKITLPMVLRATLPVIIMTFSFNFNNFGAIYFLTGGGPNWIRTELPASMQVSGAPLGQTDILISWIYKLSFTAGSQFYNIAAVFSILIFLIVGGFSIFNLAKAKSFWEED